jgi:hypothetical protein
MVASKWPLTPGDSLTLVCSCLTEVVVSTIIWLPRHLVVRITTRGSRCRQGHLKRERVVVKWRMENGRRVFESVLKDS